MLLKAQNSITRVGNFSPKKTFLVENTLEVYLFVMLALSLNQFIYQNLASPQKTGLQYQETQLPAIKQINKKNINNKNGLGEVLKITNLGFRLEFKLWLHSMPSA